MALKIYDPNEYSVIAMGIPIDGGYADGEFIRVEQQEQSFTAVVGTDGEVTRSKSNNKLTVVHIILMQTAAANAALSALHNLDLAGSNGAGVGPLLIRDRQGTTVFAASKAWISKPPDVSLDREATSRDWEITCIMDARLDGGN